MPEAPVRASGMALPVDRSPSRRYPSSMPQALRLPLALAAAHLLLVSSTAGAQSEPNPTRALSVGVSATMLTSEPALGSRAVAPGVSGTYEFLVSPRFGIGLHASYRVHPTETRLSQLIYGALLRHRLGDPLGPLTPFLEYGLLVSMNFLEGRPGSGIAHDTKLGGGAEFDCLGQRWSAGLAYHIGRLGFFEAPALRLNAIELELAWTTRW